MTKYNPEDYKIFDEVHERFDDPESDNITSGYKQVLMMPTDWVLQHQGDSDKDVDHPDIEEFIKALKDEKAKFKPVDVVSSKDGNIIEEGKDRALAAKRMGMKMMPTNLWGRGESVHPLDVISQYEDDDDIKAKAEYEGELPMPKWTPPAAMRGASCDSCKQIVSRNQDWKIGANNKIIHRNCD